MRGGNGSSKLGSGAGSPGSDGLHSLDGAGSSNGSSTQTQDASPGTGRAVGGDEGGISEKAWFAPVEESDYCKDGVCTVPWLIKEEKPTIQEDTVNHPSHYTDGGIECIEAIEAQLTQEEYRGYLKGNIAKYVWRERHKGGVESLKKAQWYLSRLIEMEGG